MDSLTLFPALQAGASSNCNAANWLSCHTVFRTYPMPLPARLVSFELDRKGVCGERREPHGK